MLRTMGRIFSLAWTLGLLAAAPGWAEKSAGTARAWAIFPGAGHVYAGETAEGVLIFAVEGYLGFQMAGSILPGEEDRTNLIGPYLGIYVWQIYDAGQSVHRREKRRQRHLWPSSNRASSFFLGYDEPQREVRCGWHVSF